MVEEGGSRTLVPNKGQLSSLFTCPPHLNQQPVPFLSPSLLGWLSYSVPWNPGPHNAWVLSR